MSLANRYLARFPRSRASRAKGLAVAKFTQPDRPDTDPVHIEFVVPNLDSVDVDLVNDLVIASSHGPLPQGKQSAYTPSTDTLLAFNPTDSGDVAARAWE